MTEQDTTTDHPKPKRPRGTGSIFQMRGSSKLWIQYRKGGRTIRESSGTDKVKQAEKFLQKRLGEISNGNFIGPKLEKIRVDELAEDFLRDYRINSKRSYGHAEARWRKHLQPFFGGSRAIDVTSARIAQYVDARQKEGAENATINRELAALRRMFNLARRATPPKVATMPYFAMLHENNVRTGFLTDEQYTKLANECATAGLWLRAAFEVGYTWGWRKGEVLALRVRQVNLAEGRICLPSGSTKNKDGRMAKMPARLRELIAQCIHGKSPDDFVFTREGAKPVKDFRTAWRNACLRAGLGRMVCGNCLKRGTKVGEEKFVALHDGACPVCSGKDESYVGLFFHDLRRTGARNMRRDGTHEGTIMKIGGWKTRSMFDRYNIIDQSDIDDAMRKLEARQAVQANQAFDRVMTELPQSEGGLNPSARHLPLPSRLSN